DDFAIQNRLNDDGKVLAHGSGNTVESPGQTSLRPAKDRGGEIHAGCSEVHAIFHSVCNILYVRHEVWKPGFKTLPAALHNIAEYLLCPLRGRMFIEPVRTGEPALDSVYHAGNLIFQPLDLIRDTGPQALQKIL